MAPQNPRDMRDWMRTVERLSAQVRAVPAMVGNAVKVVEDKAEENKVRHPAAPIELDVQTAVYNDPAHRWQLARLTVDFPDVVFNTDGTKADIQQYELWGYAQTDALEDVEEKDLPWKIQSSSTDSNFQVQEYSQGSTWTMRVRALGADTVVPGEWSDSFTVTMKRDDTVPPQSTAPKLTVGHGTITVEWDRKAVTGEMPADFDHLIVAAGTAASPTAEVARLDRDTWFHVHTGAEYFTPMHFRFRAVDQSGNAGPWSEQATAFTKPLVDKDVILSELDAGKTRIINAGKIALDANTTLESKLKANDTALADANKTLTGAGGLTERLTGAENKLKDVGALTLADGKTLQAKLTENATAIANTNTSLTGQGGLTSRLVAAESKLADVGALTYATGQTLRQKLAEGDTAIANTKLDLTRVADRVTPLETGLNTLTTTTIPGLQTSVDGKTAIWRKTAAPATADTAPAGTRWEHWSNLNANGKLLGTYRRSDSNTWVQDALDATYLPQVDIATGTFGNLSGGRLIVGSVAADKVMIGLGENLLVDPSFEDAVISQRRASSNAAGAWSWVQDTLGGSYMFTESATLGDMQLGNASNGEAFPIDPQGAMAFTVDAEGPDLLQVYLQVRYADGTAATGPYLKDLKTGGTRKTVTAQWDFATMAKSASGSPPVSTRPILRRKASTATVTGANKVYSVRYAPATKGELIVNGSITGDHVDAGSVAAKVGSFLSLGVEQLTVTGAANLKTAVADRLFANIFATNKLTTNEMIVGKGANLIPWFGSNPAASRSIVPHLLGAGVTVSYENTGGRSGGPHPLLTAGTIPPGTLTEVFRFMPGAPARNGLNNTFDVEANTTYKASVWVRAGGNYANGMPKVKLQTQRYTGAAAYESASVVESNTVTLSSQWQEIKLEFKTTDTSASVILRIISDQPGVVRIDDPILVKDGASLIATGGIVADHITASESMSAKIGQFLTLGVDKLTVTATANLQTVVADKLFANIFATNRLTASQVLIGEGGNFLGDPNFLDTAGWASGASWITAQGGRNGNNAYVIPANVNQVGGYYGSTDRNRQFTVVPDASYRLSVWVKPDADVPVAGAAMYMKWTTPTGPSSGTSFSDPGAISNTEVLPAGVWTKISGIVKLPAEAVKGFIGLFTQKNVNIRAAFSEPSVIQAVDQGLIVDNGILAKHITASEEMSAKVGQFLKLNVTDLVSTGTANINEAVVTKLFTETFATRKLTAQQVYLGNGANLFPAELNDPFWQPTAGVTFHADGGRYGGTSLRLPASTAQVVTYFAIINNIPDRQKMLKITPGSTYRVRASFRADGPVPKDGVSIYMRLYGETGTAYTFASSAIGPLVNNDAAVAANAWGQIDGMLTVPADSTNLYAGVGLAAQGGTTSAVRFSDLMIQEGVIPELVVDGAITTKKLTVTEEMTVELLKAHKVKAAEIDINSLTADTGFVGSMRTNILTSKIITTEMLKSDVITSDLIKGDAIGAKHTLTGPTIRTAASGYRTEMTKEGIRTVNANGQELVKLGFGLDTGLAVRNPNTGQLVGLGKHVFGTTVFEGTFALSRNDIPMVAPEAVSKLFIRNTSTYQPHFFTAQSTKVLLLVTVGMHAWVHPTHGLKSNGPDFAKVGVDVRLKDSLGYEVPYQINIFPPAFSVQYDMIRGASHTTFQIINLLTPGERYQTEITFTMWDQATIWGRAFPEGATVVAIPI